jgi:DNA-binding SARP family transcriptional activator/DNA uptake protein ComE-like DNA-binding protein
VGDDLRFEILGPLCAWRGEDRLDLGPGKQRAVLAVLLLNAGRPVSTEAIIDAVWPQDPPENGPNVVQKYVAGLRRVLEPGRSPRTPGRLPALTEAGYVLERPPQSLDVEVFRAHVARARELGAEGGAELRAALDLWRGEALGGLRGPLFDSARRRLAEERAAAFEEYAKIEVAAGRHAGLVPELAQVVEEFPLREELRYWLILALYRSGRQADALIAYRDARDRLVEELGVEPGERLRDLQLGILRAEPPPTPAIRPPQAPAAPGDVLAAPPVLRVAAAAPRPPRRSWRLLVATAVPLATFGTGTWALFAYLAGRRHSRALALAAGGYFTLISFFLVVLLGTDAEAVTPLDGLAAAALLVTMFGGAVHAAGVASAPTAVPPESARRIRREQARTLADHYPEIAVHLGIGRPDLSRLYDDGGLVDVNAAPEHVLAALPGVTAEQARLIVLDRDRHGPFTSPADVVTRGLLPAPTAASLHGTLVAVRPATATLERNDHREART